MDAIEAANIGVTSVSVLFATVARTRVCVLAINGCNARAEGLQLWLIGR